MIDEEIFDKAVAEIQQDGAYYQEVDPDRKRSDTILEVLAILDKVKEDSHKLEKAKV